MDTSEDYLVSDKLYALVGNEMIKFRTELMTSRSEKTLKEVIRKLIPPKGVKRKGNDEGIESSIVSDVDKTVFSFTKHILNLKYTKQ